MSEMKENSTMPNRVFNLRRFYLLVKKDFYTQYKTFLIALGAVFAILFFVNAVSILTANSWNFNHVFYPLTLFIGGFIFTSSSFSELSNEQSRSFYLTIPASCFEKLLSKLIISGPCYVLVSLLLYSVFSLTVFLLTTMFFGLAHRIFNPFDDVVWNSIRVYLVTQSVFLLGAVYFKRNSFMKTVLSVFIISVSSLLCIAAFAFVFYKTVSFGNHVYFSLDFIDIIVWKKCVFPYGVTAVLKIAEFTVQMFFRYFMAPFLWITSFFLLKETEV